MCVESPQPCERASSFSRLMSLSRSFIGTIRYGFLAGIPGEVLFDGELVEMRGSVESLASSAAPLPPSSMSVLYHLSAWSPPPSRF